MSRLILWLRHAKKATAPAVVGFVAALVDAFVTWSIDWAQLRYALGGVVTALVVFKLENEPRDVGDVAFVPPSQRLDHDGHPDDYAGTNDETAPPGTVPWLKDPDRTENPASVTYNQNANMQFPTPPPETA